MKKKLSKNKAEKIIIDQDKDIIFDSEENLFKYFAKNIDLLEEEYFSLKKQYNKKGSKDFTKKEVSALEDLVEKTLEDPDEIWRDTVRFENVILDAYVLHVENHKEFKGPFYYVALCYVTEEGDPTFLYLHFATKNEQVLNGFCKQELIYDRSIKDVYQGALEGDALSDGDELAIGLYKAMIVLRSDIDFKEQDFREYINEREDTIQSPDEIWKKVDTYGHTLVTFVKEFADPVNGKLFSYIVVTLEDENTESHILLFSFPTMDNTLAERYQQGENLHAEAVQQEQSH